MSKPLFKNHCLSSGLYIILLLTKLISLTLVKYDFNSLIKNNLSYFYHNHILNVCSNYLLMVEKVKSCKMDIYRYLDVDI